MSSRGGRGRGGRGRGARGGRGRGRGSAIKTNDTVQQSEREAPKPREIVPAIMLNEIPFELLSPSELRSLKVALLNSVSSSLIKEPRFTESGSVTNAIKLLVKRISFYDPEFILKLSLYARDELNIRSTSNYLVSLSANIKSCQPHLRKYFNAVVRLPSDWLDIAATFHMLPDRYLKGDGSLPTALRKAMLDKFPDFDAYQLGKYNKEKTIKKKAKKAKANKEKADSPDTKEAKPALTIKQMIRQLHISEPPYNVMCILGKKYPATDEEFKKCKLPGEFEPARANKRMKLPTPETWETLLSEKGNKASTWETLIEHKKLPFMAMLRNLRNLIFTGVHPKYHRWVMNKLSNETTVAMSRQFPTQFFSAYEVIPKDLEDFKAKLLEQNKPKEGQKQRAKKALTPAYMPPASLFDEYRQALDTAVKLATKTNVKPIKGSTVVFCNVSQEMKADCSTARGLGALKKLDEVGILLGLMCKYICEECDFRIFCSSSSTRNKCHVPVELKEGSILDNMKIVLDMAAAEFQGAKGTEFPFDYLEELILSRKKIDNFIILSHTLIAPGHAEMAADQVNTITNILKKYRQEINPDLLFVSVDLSGRGITVMSEADRHPNDILITGFSDAILRFIAERGDNNQLRYVENIDYAKKLRTTTEKKSAESHFDELDKLASKDAKDNLLNQMLHSLPQWRTARIFISSTFLDMHAERDVLTRHVFPELRERCKQRNINVVEVDLRWGVTEEETQQNRSIQICLDEVDRCRPFFISLLGSRYGWCPKEYTLPDESKYSWVQSYPSGRSITELEIQYGSLRDAKSHSFFYFRDASFQKHIPEEYRAQFLSESSEAAQNIENLKQLIKSSGKRVYDYKCQWGGIYDGKPMVKALESFRKRVLEDLWSAICTEFPEDNSLTLDDPLLTERAYHLNFLQLHSSKFILRKELDDLKKAIDSHNMILLVGTEGSGKSALAAAFAREYSQANPHIFILPHFIGAAPNSTNIRHSLKRLCNELCRQFALPQENIPDDYNELCQTFVALVEQASFKGRVLLILDALDQLSKTDRAHSFDWLPTTLPAKVILSAVEGPIVEVLRARKIHEIVVGQLSVKERKDIVRATLLEFNKKLDERPMNDQMRVLLKKTDSHKPLYLVVACHELRLFGVYEQLTEKIKALSPTINKLFEEVLVRLEYDHGKELVRTIACLIHCSRGGLRESELLELLKRKQVNEDSLPQAIWSRIYSSMQAILRVMGEAEVTLDFFHREVSKAVHKRYLEYDQDQEVRTHKMLAEYYYQKADPQTDSTWKGESPRAFSELPYHLTKAKLWKALEKTLCNLLFIEKKFALRMSAGLISDFVLATDEQATWKGNERAKESVAEISKFVRSNSHILAHHPNLTYQQASNQPDSTAPAKAARSLGAPEGKFWLKWLNKPQKNDSCRMTIKVPEQITATCFSPDGSQMVLATKDCVMKILHSQTGLEHSTLVGHSAWVTYIDWAADGTKIVSACADGTVKIWDAYLSVEITTLSPTHNRLVSFVAFSPDTKVIVSASWDCSVKLWDAADRRLLHNITVNMKPVNFCCFSADSQKLLSSSWDSLIKVFGVQEGSELATLTGHSKSIRSCKFSPNGKHIVSASVDNMVKIWDAVAGKEITTLQGHSSPVNSVCYSSDGLQLCSASDDRTLKVWDAILGKEVISTFCRSGWMNCCAVSQDGTKIVAGGSECYLSVWNTSDLNEVGTLVGHTRAINCCKFDPTGKYIVSGAEDQLLILWDAVTYSIVHVMKGHRDSVNCCQFSPDGTQIISASDDFTVKLWDVATGSLVQELSGHTAVVKACAFAPNGKFIASGGRDSEIHLWNANSGKLLNRFKGSKDWINCLAFSPDSKKIVSGSWVRISFDFSDSLKDYNLKIWDVAKAKDKLTLMGHGSAVAACQFSKDGKQVISCSFDGSCKVWDAKAGSEITSLIGHNKRINWFDIVPTNGDVVTVSDDGGVKIWDPLAGLEIQTLIGHANTIKQCSFSPSGQILSTDENVAKIWDVTFVDKEIIGHQKPVTCLAFTPDAKLLASGSTDKTIKLWDTASSKCIRTLRAHTATIRALAFSSDGTLLASGADDNTALLFEVPQGTLIKTLAGHTRSVRSVCFDPSGRQCATASYDLTVRIHEVATGKCVSILRGHKDWITSVAWSSNGKYLATGSYDNTCIVWTTSGQQRFTLSHNNWVTWCAFSADALQLVTCCFDGGLFTWDTEKGIKIASYTGHKSRVNGAAYSSNNRALLSASNDATLRIWSTSTKAQAAEFVCSSPTSCIAISTTNQIAVADDIGAVYLLKQAL